MFKSVEDFQKFSQEQVEAATQSATAFSAGIQQLFAATTELSKKNIETGRGALQDLMESKSVDRALQVQIDFAKTAFDGVVAGTSNLTGIVSSTAQDVFKPFEGVFAKVKEAASSNLAA